MRIKNDISYMSGKLRMYQIRWAHLNQVRLTGIRSCAIDRMWSGFWKLDTCPKYHPPMLAHNDICAVIYNIIMSKARITQEKLQPTCYFTICLPVHRLFRL